jgi:hypothetical protein
MSTHCSECGEPLPLSWVCLLCEHEAALGRRLDRIPAAMKAEVEQPRMFEVPRDQARLGIRGLYEAAQRHDAA